MREISDIAFTFENFRGKKNVWKVDVEMWRV